VSTTYNIHCPLGATLLITKILNTIHAHFIHKVCNLNLALARYKNMFYIMRYTYYFYINKIVYLYNITYYQFLIYYYKNENIQI